VVADEWDRTIDRFLAHLTAERGLSRHTVSGYRRDLRRLADYLRGAGRHSASDLRREDVEEFLAHLATGDGAHAALAPASVARALAAVRAMLAFEVGEGRLADDPSREVPAPLLPRRLPKAISYEQVVKLLDGARAQPDAILRLRDSALLELLYGTGARISELTALDVDDLPESGEPEGLGMLMLYGKGGKERLVPFGRAAQAALAAYLVRGRASLAERGSFSPALFLNARGGRLSRQNAYLVLQRAAERADLGVVVSPHTLRHSFATHLLDGGADVRVVQELLGHASVTTTQIYTLITPQRMLEEYRTSHPRARTRRG
jgi:integrase/recombinase XerD